MSFAGIWQSLRLDLVASAMAPGILYGDSANMLRPGWFETTNIVKPEVSCCDLKTHKCSDIWARLSGIKSNSFKRSARMLHTSTDTSTTISLVFIRPFLRALQRHNGWRRQLALSLVHLTQSPPTDNHLNISRSGFITLPGSCAAHPVTWLNPVHHVFLRSLCCTQPARQSSGGAPWRNLVEDEPVSATRGPPMYLWWRSEGYIADNPKTLCLGIYCRG